MFRQVVPQWLLNAACYLDSIDFSCLNIFGALFSVMGSILYAFAASRPWKLIWTKTGCQYRYRDEKFGMGTTTTTSTGRDVEEARGQAGKAGTVLSDTAAGTAVGTSKARTEEVGRQREAVIERQGEELRAEKEEQLAEFRRQLDGGAPTHAG